MCVCIRLCLRYNPLLSLQDELNKAREDRDVTRAELIKLEAEMVRADDC